MRRMVVLIENFIPRMRSTSNPPRESMSAPIASANSSTISCIVRSSRPLATQPFHVSGCPGSAAVRITSSMISLPTYSVLTGSSERMSRMPIVAIVSGALVPHTSRNSGPTCRSAPSRSRNDLIGGGDCLGRAME